MNVQYYAQEDIQPCFAQGLKFCADCDLSMHIVQIQDLDLSQLPYIVAV